MYWQLKAHRYSVLARDGTPLQILAIDGTLLQILATDGKATGPNGITKRGFEASPAASGIPPGPDFYRYPPHPSLPNSVEARSSDLYTETGDQAKVLTGGRRLSRSASRRPPVC